MCSMKLILKRLLWCMILAATLPGCAKHFLESKPSTTIFIPGTLSNFQTLLDNTAVFGQVPTVGEASTDDYYFVYAYWTGLDTRQHNAYIWKPDIFESQPAQQDWNTPYQQVFYANVVLDGLGNQPEQDSIAQWYIVKGEALFLRAFAFYNLAQVFAPVYDPGQAKTAGLGIPLRLHSEINTPSIRSTLEQTYQQIIDDLVQAEQLLPTTRPSDNSYRNRPVQVAAQALLARVYLSMRNYSLARVYADSALQAYDSLIDYNGLDYVNTAFPIGVLNHETLYQAEFLGSVQYNNTNYPCSIAGGFFTNTRIDSALIQSYDSNDLRKVIYYRYKPSTSYTLRGSYAGNNYCFGGIATDELYLISAEGAARAGDLVSAADDINTLLAKRWKTGTFPGYSFSTTQEALDTVLLERRKELAFRGLRWTDLRRLNADGAGIVLTRNLNGTVITLQPNSNLYTLPIPPDVISLSGMPQNARN
jgi:starch-binding outer membrane protein, SusD/RagB family